MISRQQLIDEFSGHLAEGSGAMFVGAGLSAHSGAPDWVGLLKPHLAHLGINIDEHDDLPLMAQHVVNQALRNRGPLLHAIQAAFARLDPPNQYHLALQQMNLPLIWTTNFDTLLETALASQAVVVRTSDRTITQRVTPCAVEIIKMHGCIRQSGIDELVLTKEDYEDFFVRRPALTERLTMDLLHKSFLFVGYRLGDPNINNILVHARRLCQNATPSHYMLLKARTHPEAQRRAELWAVDLARVGIQCCFVPSHADTESALFEIARKSRGRSLFVTGSHQQPAHPLAADIGVRLATATRPIVLLDGQSTGISRTVINAYVETCLQHNKDIYRHLRLFPNPYAANPAFSNDPKLLPALKTWRTGLLRSAQVVLVFDGQMGTQSEIDLAQTTGCRIIPVPGDPNGLARRLVADPAISSHLPVWYQSAAQNGTVSAADVVRCIEELMV